MSFIVGISQTTNDSCTLYNPELTIRDDRTWYDDFGVTAALAQSGPESAAAKDWSATVYPTTAFGSGTASSYKYFYAGVSFTNKAPAGVYKFRFDLTGTYSTADGAATLDETWSYIYASRSRRTAALSNWEKKTGHVVYFGTDKHWVADPVGYINETTGVYDQEPVTGILSSADEVLGGVSRTERPY
jgi:hypothetical protein